ncbi:Uncharacterised protein [Bordetella pertussis]|nr:Uncharacterised protein [Bordetella pertussis]
MRGPHGSRGEASRCPRMAESDRLANIAGLS